MIKSRKESEVIYLLLDQYDKDQKAILRPEHVVKKKKGFPETVVFEFSQALIMETAKRYRGVEAGHLVSVAGNTPIYKIDYHGRELGISKMSVSRIAAKLGLRRTKEQVYKVSSRIRCEMIRRERRRVIFGLDPVTRIKVVSNRARVRLRSRLKGIGYIVSEERNILYYTVSLVRKEHLEHRGTKLGLRFLPFPQDTTTLFTAII